MSGLSGMSDLSDFYPRPPQGGRQPAGQGELDDDIFLSTPSARRATLPNSTVVVTLLISIHALREEGDSPMMSAGSSSTNFYPRPPRGGRG